MAKHDRRHLHVVADGVSLAALALAGVPTLARVGGDDKTVPPMETRRMYRRRLLAAHHWLRTNYYYYYYSPLTMYYVCRITCYVSHVPYYILGATYY